MDHTTKNIFIACFFGALVGTVLALQLGGYLWWLALPVGAVVGYVAYEFKKVVRAVGYAWRVTVSWRPNWAGCREYVWNVGKAFATLLLALPAAFMATCLMFAILFGPSGFVFTNNGVLVSATDVFVRIITVVLFVTITTFLFCSIIFGTDKKASEALEELGWSAFRYGNPISFFFYWAPYGAILLVREVWRTFLPGCWRFVCIALREIHSDIRMLCAVDATIGVVVGYFFGSPLAGGLFGGVFGALNYEIFSKRILKITKIRT